MLGLAVLLLVTGCTAGQFGGLLEQEQPVQLVLNNTADSTHTFEVWVTEFPSNATVRRDNGLNATFNIGPGLRTHPPRENYTYTSVEHLDSARLHGRYTLAPGESNQSSIEEFPRDFAVVVVVYQAENEIIEWASSHCDETLVGMRVTSRHVGPQPDISAAYICR